MIRERLHPTSIVLSLYEHHGEYPLPRHTWGDKGFARADLSIDFFDVLQLLETNHEPGEAEEIMEDLAGKLPPELKADGAEYGQGFVYQLAGSYDELRKNLDEYADQLFEREPSGDDDSFDYWPGGFDTLWAFATDLDELTGHSVCRLHIIERFKSLGWRPNDEWRAPWEDEIPEIE